MTEPGDRGRIVRTVGGDVDPATLGFVLGHEHLIGHPPADRTEPDLVLDDADAMVKALRGYAEQGAAAHAASAHAPAPDAFPAAPDSASTVAAPGARASSAERPAHVDVTPAVVEMTTVDYGRDIRMLADLMDRSGVAIVAATGFNKGAFANRITDRYGEEELARWMISEIRDGALGYADPDRIDLRGPSTNVLAGLIKGASGRDGPDENERKALRAAVAAHLATGAPIGTHTEKGTWVADQAAFLVDAGAQPDSVLIGHCDFLPGVDELLEVARTGVRIGFDQFGKEKYLPDRVRVERIAGLASEGFLDRIIVAGDLARRSYHPELANGGRSEAGHAPGLSHIPREVVPMLAAAGLTQADIGRIVHGNPVEWLAFTPLAY